MAMNLLPHEGPVLVIIGALVIAAIIWVNASPQKEERKHALRMQKRERK